MLLRRRQLRTTTDSAESTPAQRVPDKFNIDIWSRHA